MYARIIPKAIYIGRSSQYRLTQLNIEIEYDTTQFKRLHSFQQHIIKDCLQNLIGFMYKSNTGHVGNWKRYIKLV